MPQNYGAWQEKCGTPLSVRETPYPSTLTPCQMVIRVHAWAINPCDLILQEMEMSFVKYPVILGEDIAGEVTAVGSAVTRFSVGSRAISFAQGVSGGSTQGGFQNFVVVEEALSAPIPNHLSFEEASVLPLGFSTAAHALANTEYLALPVPGSVAAKEGRDETGKDRRRSVFIWGGSSSVGSNAIQLAVAAGLEVVTTASPKNFETLKSLGATKMFDYKSEDVVADVVAELNGDAECVGIFQAAGAFDSIASTLDIAKLIKADAFVVTTTPLNDGMVPEGVRAKFLFGSDQTDILGIWSEYLPKALEEKKYAIAPEPMVLQTRGLKAIQEGYMILKNGVSAKKVVVVAE